MENQIVVKKERDGHGLCYSVYICTEDVPMKRVGVFYYKNFPQSIYLPDCEPAAAKIKAESLAESLRLAGE